MHDVEGDVEKERKYELRKVGLVGIRQAVNLALNQTGIGLTERFCKALEKAFGIHRDWNIAHPEAMLELTDDRLKDILNSINQFGFITYIGAEELILVLQEIKRELQQGRTLQSFVVKFLKDVKLNNFRGKIKEVLQEVIIEAESICPDDKVHILGIQPTELKRFLIGRFIKNKNMNQQEIDFLKNSSKFMLSIFFDYKTIDKMLKESEVGKNAILTILEQLSNSNEEMKNNLLRVLTDSIIPDTYVDDSYQFLPAESEEKNILANNIEFLVNLRKNFIRSEPQDRVKLNNIEKLITELVKEGDLVKYFSEEEAKYFTILKNSKNNGYLIQVASTSTNDIMYRLYAFMYLEINRYEDPGYNKSAIVSDLISAFKNKIMNFEFYTGSQIVRTSEFGVPESVREGFINFRLRSLITGVNLILISLLEEQFGKDIIINPTQLKELYDLISKAVFTMQTAGEAGK
ncbi:MAG: hypothetical protein LBD98_05240 [Endomicrobium sp.]|nr:hypothetical protein [Endomicrobium sp.]